ncbi:MAG: hypothetical protein ACLU6Y_05720 [Ruminococcus sp.]
MSEAQILLYNFKDENRLRQIRRYLNRTEDSLPDGATVRVPGEPWISV